MSIELHELNPGFSYIITRESLEDIGAAALSSVLNADTIAFDQPYLLFTHGKLRGLIEESRSSALISRELMITEIGTQMYEGVIRLYMGIRTRQPTSELLEPTIAEEQLAVFPTLEPYISLSTNNTVEHITPRAGCRCYTCLAANSAVEEEEPIQAEITDEAVSPETDETSIELDAPFTNIASSRREALRFIIREKLGTLLSEKGFKTIRVINYDDPGKHSQTTQTDAFEVLINCCAHVPQPGTRLIVIPNTLFNITVSNPYINAIQDPNADATPIIVDNREIGSVGSNYAYLYWSAISLGSRDEISIFENILEIIASHIQEKPNPQDMYRDSFVTFCNNRLQTQTTKAETDRDTARSHIESHRIGLTEKTRVYKDLNELIAHLQLRSKTQTSETLKEWSRICIVNHVKKIAVTDSQINIITDEILVKDDRSNLEHKIGRFEVALFHDGKIRFYNLDRRVSAYQGNMNAPHVYADGSACFGNIETAISEAMGNFELSIVVQLVISFLESVNTDDEAGKYVHWWPFVEEVKCAVCDYAPIDVGNYKMHVQDYHGESWLNFRNLHQINIPVIPEERGEEHDEEGCEDDEYYEEDG